jgi:hypothetical protein
MLRTLLTEEIKLFHSPLRVGLAYMVQGVPERQNSDIFSPGYFGCRGVGALEFADKIAIPDNSRCLFALTWSPSQRISANILPSAIPNGAKRAEVNHIANFAVLLTPNRKK